MVSKTEICPFPVDLAHGYRTSRDLVYLPQDISIKLHYSTKLSRKGHVKSQRINIYLYYTHFPRRWHSRAKVSLALLRVFSVHATSKTYTNVWHTNVPQWALEAHLFWGQGHESQKFCWCGSCALLWLLASSISDSYIPSPITSSSSDSPLCSSITPLSFTSGLKPTCFTNHTPFFLYGLPSRTTARTASFELVGFYL